jgi:hypothetical protein
MYFGAAILHIRVTGEFCASLARSPDRPLARCVCFLLRKSMAPQQQITAGGRRARLLSRMHSSNPAADAACEIHANNNNDLMTYRGVYRNFSPK